MADDEWAFVAPYLALLPQGSGAAVHDLRQVINVLRYVLACGKKAGVCREILGG